jgi:hypothetical protein
MMLVLVVALDVVVAAVAVAALRSPRRRQPAPVVEPSWWERTQRRLVMVHTTDDKTYRGLLVEAVEDGVLLTSVELLLDQGAPVALGGEAFLPHRNVAWIQLPPGEAKP